MQLLQTMQIKTYFFVFTLMCLLASCQHVSQENFVGTYDHWGGHGWAVLKFPEPSYADYVYAVPDQTRTYYFIYIPDKCSCPEFYKTRKPLIKLVDDYYITNLGWAPNTFAPLSVYQPRLLNVKWSQMTSVKQHWDVDSVSEIKIEPAEVMYWVNTRPIDEYLGKTWERSAMREIGGGTYKYDYDMIPSVISETMYSDTIYMRQIDSLTNVYIDLIRELVITGEIEAVSQKIKQNYIPMDEYWLFEH